jgi:hypothetical protein
MYALGGSMVGESPAASPDVEKLVAILYRQQDARLRRIAVSRIVRTVTFVIEAWRSASFKRD